MKRDAELVSSSEAELIPEESERLLPANKEAARACGCIATSFLSAAVSSCSASGLLFQVLLANDQLSNHVRQVRMRVLHRHQ